jgi:UDPglucose--hexose-1-phosphate uridylyltransferase
MLDWLERPHRRLNPLTGEWVLVSPQRTERPWQGQTEQITVPQVPAYDPSCYLCPGNQRAHGVRNPDYPHTFVFDNDFPAMTRDVTGESLNDRGLLVARSEKGICRVACFSPRHDLSIPTMSREDVTAVVNTWCDQYSALRDIPFLSNIQVFENRGPQMGVSNLHPHCQIWANEDLPNAIVKEDNAQRAYEQEQGSCLLCAYLTAERGGERMVCENDSFSVLVPFWAVWPFETLLVSKRHLGGMDELTAAERADLAGIMQSLVKRYDALFQVPFPYSMGFHQRPKGGSDSAWHFHAHYYPPLLRSATIRKFMVGYEMLAGPQRDLTAETAASRLRQIERV